MGWCLTDDGPPEHLRGRTPPDGIPAEYWDALPAELRPGLLAIVAAFEARSRPRTLGSPSWRRDRTGARL